jgi:dTMP kinase
VLCDRFIDSSFAYQCGGRGLPADNIELLVQRFVSRLPDRTLWLDAPIEVGMARAAQRAALDRFEQERADFFERVRAVFVNRAAADPMRIRRLDATQTSDQVFTQALAVL